MLAHIDDASCHRGGRNHCRAHQMGPRALALSAFKVAIGGRGTALTRFDPVAIHPDAERASAARPCGPRLNENIDQPVCFGLPRDLGGPRRYEQRHFDLIVEQYPTGLKQIRIAAIGTRSDKGLIDGHCCDRLSGSQTHIAQRGIIGPIRRHTCCYCGHLIWCRAPSYHWHYV